MRSLVCLFVFVWLTVGCASAGSRAASAPLPTATVPAVRLILELPTATPNPTVTPRPTSVPTSTPAPAQVAMSPSQAIELIARGLPYDVQSPFVQGAVVKPYETGWLVKANCGGSELAEWLVESFDSVRVNAEADRCELMLRYRPPTSTPDHAATFDAQFAEMRATSEARVPTIPNFSATFAANQATRQAGAPDHFATYSASMQR